MVARKPRAPEEPPKTTLDNYCLKKKVEAAARGEALPPMPTLKAETKDEPEPSGRSGLGAPAESRDGAAPAPQKRARDQESNPTRPTSRRTVPGPSTSGWQPTPPTAEDEPTKAAPGSSSRTLPQRFQQDAATWVANFIKNNKKEYNAFYYRLKKLPESQVDEWKQIQATGTAEDADEFVNRIRSGKISNLSISFTKIMERTQFLRSWKTWKDAQTKYDEDTLLSMIKAKTVQTRRDPSIPEHLGVEWPKFLQIKTAEETDLTQKDQGQELRTDNDLEDDEFEQEEVDLNAWHPTVEQQSARSDRSIGGPRGQQEQQLQDSGEKKMPEEVMVALKSVRLAHSTCDKFVRDLKGAIVTSQVGGRGE